MTHPVSGLPICERLRAKALEGPCPFRPGHCYCDDQGGHDVVGNPDGPEAADAIEGLVAAGERLMRELGWVNEQLDLMPDDYGEAQADLAAALAKVRAA